MTYNRGKKKSKPILNRNKYIYKSNGEGRVMVLDLKYNFLRWATDEETDNF